MNYVNRLTGSKYTNSLFVFYAWFGPEVKYQIPSEHVDYRKQTNLEACFIERKSDYTTEFHSIRVFIDHKLLGNSQTQLLWMKQRVDERTSRRRMNKYFLFCLFHMLDKALESEETFLEWAIRTKCSRSSSHLIWFSFAFQVSVSLQSNIILHFRAIKMTIIVWFFSLKCHKEKLK